MLRWVPELLGTNASIPPFLDRSVYYSFPSLISPWVIIKCTGQITFFFCSLIFRSRGSAFDKAQSLSRPYAVVGLSLQ